MLLSWLGNFFGNIAGKYISSAMDSHFSHKKIQEQLAAQKSLFEFENRNKHQFEVDDLRAAGLNPMLSATNPSAIGVGGVTAPNWTSDDDVYGSAVQMAQQSKSLDIQEKQANAAALNAEAALIQAHNSEVASSAKANLDNTNASIAWMKADTELQNLVQELKVKNANIQYLSGKFEEAIAAAQEHKAGAKDKLESAIGRKISNSEEKFILDMINDPDLKDTPTRNALILAKGLNLNTSERLGLVAAITGHKFRPKQEKVNENANSGVSAFDDIVKYNVD